MTTQQAQEHYEIGMIGLGVMGRNLALNMADHGFSVAGYDKDPGKVTALRQESGERAVRAFDTIKEFALAHRNPKTTILLVPAGSAVDSVIDEMIPHLDKGDLIVDAGNSNFRDTDLRIRKLAEKGIHFLGVGVSGGEQGARHGPSIMPGGAQEAYERVRLVFEAISAKVNEEPCVTWLGPGSAGHYVKMVHNGIEYAVMQLIAETYDLMKRGIGLNNEEIHNVFETWNSGELSGYLMEITCRIFSRKDGRTGKRLIDEILGVASQKGTGMWTSQSAMELQVPVPAIDLAVSMRDLSMFADERRHAESMYSRPTLHFPGDRDASIAKLRSALFTGMIIAYAQGMALLRVASHKYDYSLDLEAVARLWRGGCIIRAALLYDICEAFHLRRDLPNLLLDPEIARKVIENQEELRRVVCMAADAGLPAAALMSTLGYLDAYRSAWLPANLTQAQRDYFGSHTYKRIDAEGSFHTNWEEG